MCAFLQVTCFSFDALLIVPILDFPGCLAHHLCSTFIDFCKLDANCAQVYNMADMLDNMVRLLVAMAGLAMVPS